MITGNDKYGFSFRSGLLCVLAIAVCLPAGLALFPDGMTPVSCRSFLAPSRLSDVFGVEFMAFSDGEYRPLPFFLLSILNGVIPAGWYAVWRTVFVALYAFETVLAYAILSRLFDDRAAFIGAAAFTLNPFAVFAANHPEYFHFLLGGTLTLAALRFCLVRKPSRGIALAAVVVAGALSTPLAFALPPFLYLLIVWRGSNTRVALRLLAATFVGLAVAGGLAYTAGASFESSGLTDPGREVGLAKTALSALTWLSVPLLAAKLVCLTRQTGVVLFRAGITCVLWAGIVFLAVHSVAVARALSGFENWMKFEIGREPDNVLNRIRLGRFYLATGRRDMGIGELFGNRRIFDIGRSSVAMAGYYAARGDTVGQSIHVREALFRDWRYDFDTSGERYCAYRNNRGAVAEGDVFLDHVLKVVPHDPDEASALAGALAEHGMGERASRVARLVLILNPRDAVAADILRVRVPDTPWDRRCVPDWVVFAGAVRQNYRLTRDEIVVSARINEFDPVMQINSVTYLLSEKFLYEARTRAKLAAEGMPGWAAAWAVMANVFAMHEYSDDTQRALAEARRTVGKDPAALYILALAELMSPEANSAPATFARSIRNGFGVSALAHFRYGVALAKNMRYEEAVRELKKAQSLSPDDLEIDLEIAYIYERLKKYALTIPHWQRIVAAHPEDAQAVYKLGEAMIFTGDYAGAHAVLDKSLREYFHPETMRVFALLLAAAPDDALRDGETAVALAHQAIRGISNKTPPLRYLHALAAAQAEVGAFETAIAYTRDAIKLATEHRLDADKKILIKMLNLYLNMQPCRLEPGTDEFLMPPER